MIKQFTVFWLLVFSLKFHAQSSMSNALRVKLADGSLPQEFPLLVKGNAALIRSHAAILNYKFHYNAGDIASVTMNAGALSELIAKRIITRAEYIETHRQPLNDTMVKRNRIQPVHLGTAPLQTAYNGSNVIVGIIDTGIDWKHNDFKDAQGNTRILFIWDQTGGGPSPSPFNYGTEYNSAQINASLCPMTDAAGNGHGTHVAGVAAGNGLATGKNMGCAPKANIITVALDYGYNGPGIADAVQYIFAKATQLGRPCVINASVGDYYGSHDGTDLEAKLIENMVKNVPGRIMVAAAGNGGLAKFHVKTQPPAGDTAFTWLKKNTGTVYYWCYADTLQIKNIQMTVGANRPNFFNLGNIGFKAWNYALQGLKFDTIKYNGNRIGVIKSSASINAYGVYELYLTISPDTAGYFWRVESKGVGLHHAWNFDFVSTGLPTPGQHPRIAKYLMPDTLLSIVSSFQCLDDVTTVANYQNVSNYIDYNNTVQTYAGTAGQRMNYSSIGPTRDGRQKPDIAATGEGNFAAAATVLQPGWITNIPNFMAPGGKHVFGTGTSAASPVVAGLGALYLQAYPNATSMQFKMAVTNCAYTDALTGINLPDYAWGHGKLDGKAAMLCVVTGINDIVKEENGMKAFPNPFSDKTTIQFKKAINGTIRVYSVDGKLLFTDNVKGEEYTLDTAGLPHAGLLIVHVNSDSGYASFKLARMN